MSSGDEGSLRKGGRSSFLAHRGLPAFEVLLAMGAVALFSMAGETGFVVSTWPSVSVDLKRLALGMAVVAATIVAFALAARPRQPKVGVDRNPPGLTAPATDCASSGPGVASYTGDVLLKLSEPKPVGAELMLLESVRLAISESRGAAAASFTTMFADDPDDAVTMYATFFAEHVPIYGCKRPSSALEPVFMTSPSKEFAVEDGSLVLRELEGPTVYDGLSIKAADYAVVLQQLRS